MIRWQQCNLCNGSNVEAAVFRRNSWKTNYIIALLEMKALSLIWSDLGRSQISTLQSSVHFAYISLILYYDIMTYLWQTWQQYRVIMTAQMICVIIYNLLYIIIYNNDLFLQHILYRAALSVETDTLVYTFILFYYRATFYY